MHSKKTRLDVDNMSNHFFYFIFFFLLSFLLFLDQVNQGSAFVCVVGESGEGKGGLGWGVNRMGAPRGKGNVYLGSS